MTILNHLLQRKCVALLQAANVTLRAIKPHFSHLISDGKLPIK